MFGSFISLVTLPYFKQYLNEKNKANSSKSKVDYSVLLLVTCVVFI